MRSLVLIGHGSHLNPDSARAVYHYAELLRGQGFFDEVLEGYWKEEPSLRQVLRTARYTDVTVIPMFISEGYFTETVIPREMGLGHQGPVPPEGVVRQIGGVTVRYTLPYGVHPSMSEVIMQRALEACPDASPEDTALLIIGHGTTRNPNSSRVVYHNADRIRASGRFREVAALFLDEDPRVNTWPELLSSRRVVMIPFFTAEGWHTQETIPEDLGLTGAVTEFGERTVYYGLPVGTHPQIADVIVQLAQDALAQSPMPGEDNPDHEEAWAAFMTRADAGLRLGEATITPHAGLYEVRPTLDEGREDLELLATPEGLRDRVRLSDSGEYRPVHTLRNLPRGWRAVFDAADLRRAIGYLYPAVVEEGYLASQRALQATPWASTARRQTGIYTKVQQATPEEVAATSRRVCGGCLKTRLWAGDNLYRTFFDGVPGGIPCAEACTFLVSEIRETVAARQQQERELQTA
ncbi:sirohydrochlorin cobaltochelatase [Deinobacterium chartae]|uniref:Sirohydrochlorin cobaltochelatase n=1 Tax=Deinobacterium chartae TaxID=521158 RepID=A0A841I3Z1_9DEIO|nr:DR2241 family protein [Deinobacterium chartae]MBB6098722.1 sirohydrochlorin cobaltochelatase [Deinobacterium chartae]